MPQEDLDRLERMLLLHLLEHRGAQIRFEASQWTTEFGIFRKFSDVDPAELKSAIRSLEMARMIYRRTQYVIGYSEPKHVFTLTPSGHRKALEFQRDGPPPSPDVSGSATSGPDDGSSDPDPPAHEVPSPPPAVGGA